MHGICHYYIQCRQTKHQCERPLLCIDALNGHMVLDETDLIESNELASMDMEFVLDVLSRDIHYSFLNGLGGFELSIAIHFTSAEIDHQYKQCSFSQH